MTIEYKEKGLEWVGKILDDIFQTSKEKNLQKNSGAGQKKH